jgi:hypothetical protein
MFDPWCPTCAARVLLTARRLVRLVPTPTGHRAHLRCWCGTVVAMDVERIDVRGPVATGEAATVPAASPRVA